MQLSRAINLRITSLVWKAHSTFSSDFCVYCSLCRPYCTSVYQSCVRRRQCCCVRYCLGRFCPFGSFRQTYVLCNRCPYNTNTGPEMYVKKRICTCFKLHIIGACHSARVFKLQATQASVNMCCLWKYSGNIFWFQVYTLDSLAEPVLFSHDVCYLSQAPQTLNDFNGGRADFASHVCNINRRISKWLWTSMRSNNGIKQYSNY